MPQNQRLYKYKIHAFDILTLLFYLVVASTFDDKICPLPGSHIAPFHRKANSTHFDSFTGLRGLLARNQTQQGTPDRVKLGSVDEWIDAVVEIAEDD